eukprot:TRINITY_DN40949_c0_g1_i2.p2 TRINITY_DN40949_c0_g1~~TRINITY_DN40949_c0_g1_i2.p2  ORF type:complete len:121 (-),score=7.07 TRINITY_DN40949_c0_g1_i2:141-503(-)
MVLLHQILLWHLVQVQFLVHLMIILLLNFLNKFLKKIELPMGDYLFKKILAEEKDEFMSKRIVGLILSSTQGMGPQQTMDHLLTLCRDDAKRQAAVQSAKNVNVNEQQLTQQLLIIILDI